MYARGTRGRWPRKKAGAREMQQISRRNPFGMKKGYGTGKGMSSRYINFFIFFLRAFNIMV